MASQGKSTYRDYIQRLINSAVSQTDIPAIDILRKPDEIRETLTNRLLNLNKRYGEIVQKTALAWHSTELVADVLIATGKLEHPRYSKLLQALSDKHRREIADAYRDVLGGRALLGGIRWSDDLLLAVADFYNLSNPQSAKGILDGILHNILLEQLLKEHQQIGKAVNEKQLRTLNPISAVELLEMFMRGKNLWDTETMKRLGITLKDIGVPRKGAIRLPLRLTGGMPFYICRPNPERWQEGGLYIHENREPYGGDKYISRLFPALYKNGHYLTGYKFITDLYYQMAETPELREEFSKLLKMGVYWADDTNKAWEQAWEQRAGRYNLFNPLKHYDPAYAMDVFIARYRWNYAPASLDRMPAHYSPNATTPLEKLLMLGVFFTDDPDRAVEIRGEILTNFLSRSPEDSEYLNYLETKHRALRQFIRAWDGRGYNTALSKLAVTIQLLTASGDIEVKELKETTMAKVKAHYLKKWLRDGLLQRAEQEKSVFFPAMLEEAYRTGLVEDYHKDGNTYFFKVADVVVALRRGNVPLDELKLDAVEWVQKNSKKWKMKPEEIKLIVQTAVRKVPEEFIAPELRGKRKKGRK